MYYSYTVQYTVRRTVHCTTYIILYGVQYTVRRTVQCTVYSILNMEDNTYIVCANVFVCMCAFARVRVRVHMHECARVCVRVSSVWSRVYRQLDTVS